MTLVLCGPDGVLLGALEPLELGSPWWPGTQDVVEAVRAREGLDVTVLRLLHADRAPSQSGAHLAQLAQLDRPARLPEDVRLVPASSVRDDVVADHPLRPGYARPGGPENDLAWADGVLAARGTPRNGRARQVRAWNLSGIWQLPTATDPVWLKAVPALLAHEGAVLRLVGEVTDAVPPLLGYEPGRVLLGDVPGEDQYGAPRETFVRMVAVLVDLQARLSGRVEDLLDLGAFDWRPAAFEALARDVVERTKVDAETREVLDRLLDGLPERHAAVAGCGVPDSLVHGDVHPGNVRGDRSRPVVLDWGDSGVGHPLLDRAAFLAEVPDQWHEAVVEAWTAAWRAAVPGCEPDRAATLLEPVAALRLAVVDRIFLDRIEPSERIHRADDPAMWLRRAAETFTASTGRRE